MRNAPLSADQRFLYSQAQQPPYAFHLIPVPPPLSHLPCPTSPISPRLSHLAYLTSPIPPPLSHLPCPTSPIPPRLSHLAYLTSPILIPPRLSHLAYLTSPISPCLSHLPNPYPTFSIPPRLSHLLYPTLASNPKFPFQILSHNFGEILKSRTESLGLRLVPPNLFCSTLCVVTSSS